MLRTIEHFRRGVAAVLLIVLACFGATASTASLLDTLPKGLRAIAAAAPALDKPVLSVAMLGHVPTEADVAALKAQGLLVQPFKHLPMMLTKGTLPQLLKAHADKAARDFYMDEPLSLHSDVSTEAMSAHITRELGFDGTGIGIAIVDSGIDASHPAFEDRVVRNVRVYSPEYLDITGLNVPLGVTWPSEPALVIPFDALPYNNTDTIGHGTHVAGIAAGSGSDNPELVGVAPGAHLVGYSTGEILFIFTALAAFDDILAHQEEFNIRVINNSWGSYYQLFDPAAPINAATKVLHDAGITVVFSAGNSFEEMATGPNSQAPWVINVASTTVAKEKSDFSSSGLMYDNSVFGDSSDAFHLHFEGDGLGETRPDIAAPGSAIVAPGTPTGVTATTGTPPGGSASLSGTSMAAPHIAGLAAVLLQARPELTPRQVREVLQATAVPMADASEFWQVGYGFADAKAALDFVRDEDFSQELIDKKLAELDAKYLAARPYKVLASDHWKFNERLATVGGLETYEFSFDVKPETEAIRASVSFPGDLGVAGINALFEWTLELVDPAGAVVASSQNVSLFAGVGRLHADFAELGITPAPGAWTMRAVGTLHAAQPGLLWGHTVTVVATQLAKNTPASQPAKSALQGARFGGVFGLAGFALLLGALLRRRWGSVSV